MRTEKELEICLKCKNIVGDIREINYLGCAKTFDWTLIQYLTKCPIGKW
jgi:hypothetical protein